MADLNFFKFYIGKKLFARRFRQVACRLNSPVLDVGAGAQPFRAWMPTGRIWTIDMNPDARPDIVASALHSPFRDHSFQSVICTEVLEHVPEPEDCLREIRRVMRDSGILYLTTPMLWPLHYEPHDYFRYTNHGLRHLLEKTGFEIIETHPIGGFFSFVFMRIGEKAFNLIHKLAFFLPKRFRWLWSAPLTLPVFHLLYLISLALDPLMKKDVFSWSVVARTKPGT